MIAVGALDRRLRLWKDSNRRSGAAVCAPGVEIVSADASNGYVVGTGTSASSAMVAGVAALVRSRYPRLSPEEVRRALVQGSPARPGHPTGSPECRGPVDAVRTLVAANQINKTSSGPVETPPPPASTPRSAAQPSGRDSGVLFPLVLGGGGLLVVLGLVLGWRQRRRPEENPADTDAVADYGLPSAPAAPREPAVVPAAPAETYAAPVVAPVNAPLFQNNEVFPGRRPSRSRRPRVPCRRTARSGTPRSPNPGPSPSRRRSPVSPTPHRRPAGTGAAAPRRAEGAPDHAGRAAPVRPRRVQRGRARDAQRARPPERARERARPPERERAPQRA
ncbi:S8 family serine peptidase [Actinomadura luteofluorescens]|uniref:S8 family serine peptidase n=1 Tax=Actinomadura luteofluorescens TaxID=46163 RepID=UPI003632AD8A